MCSIMFVQTLWHWQQLRLTRTALLVSDSEMFQSIQKVRLLHLGESLEREGRVLGRVVLVHKLWGRDDVNGGGRQVEVAEGDPSLGCVHHSPVWHTLVLLVC